jgi:hypothetical protein
MSSAVLRSVLSFLFAAFVLQVVFVGSTLALSRALRARVRAVALGTPTLVRFEVGALRVAIGALPVVAWVEFPGRAPGDPDRGPGTWRRLSLGARLVVIIGPLIATFVVAPLLLGPARAAGSFAHAVPQLLLVVDASPLVRGFLHLLATEPLAVVVGVACAKATAFNLLPLATLAGGAVLREVVDAFRGAENDGDAAPGVAWPLVSMLFVLVWVVGRFAWGLVHALS